MALSPQQTEDGWQLLSGTPDQIIHQWSLTNIDKFHIEELRGRSRIMMNIGDTQHCLANYSHFLIAEFSAVCQALEQARRGHTPSSPTISPTS